MALPRLRPRSLPLAASHPGVDVPYAGLTTSLWAELESILAIEEQIIGGQPLEQPTSQIFQGNTVDLVAPPVNPCARR